MTEIPEHLRKRAEEARRHTLREQVEVVSAPQAEGLLPGEPFDPPLSEEERARIAVALVNLRVSSDRIVQDLLTNARQASEAAEKSQDLLVARHRTAMVVAVVGTFLACILVVVVVALIAAHAG